ncbi:DUF4232 domain-containing protein [Streptomyces sp. MH60]|uniref:DUF4232 domain-containing protein n=1 Tax=Streptomyces sp. MH60 TaxID=1940758 RepID=UPI000D440930|nr:DUF4232 domain-containing protein [Streptomyces sp. MH60]PPS85532.1 hypothetical protein BZZ08_03785 [Streptomyces sp. MH60]
MSARRITRTRLFAATTVALAALSLTACEGDELTGSPAPDSAASATAGANNAQPAGSAKDDTSETGSTGSNGSAGKDKTSDSGSGTGSGSDAATGTDDSSDDSDSDVPGECSASDVQITAANAPRPINHLLLTATNTGSKTCALPQYPAARFGEAQSVPPVAESSKPQSLTTLAPGESGYAGVRLSSGDGSGENGYETNTLTIPFEDGSIATVKLPSGGVYVDTALTVTYWQTDASNALEY